MKQVKKQKALKGVDFEGRIEGGGDKTISPKKNARSSDVDIVREPKQKDNEQMLLESRLKDYYDKYDPLLQRKRDTVNYNAFEDKILNRFDGINRSLTSSLDDQIKFLKSELNSESDKDFGKFFSKKVEAFNELENFEQTLRDAVSSPQPKTYNYNFSSDLERSPQKSNNKERKVVQIGDSFVEERASPFQVRDLHGDRDLGNVNFNFNTQSQPTFNSPRTTTNRQGINVGTNLGNNFNNGTFNPNLQSISEMVYIEDEEDKRVNKESKEINSDSIKKREDNLSTLAKRGMNIVNENANITNKSNFYPSSGNNTSNFAATFAVGKNAETFTSNQFNNQLNQGSIPLPTYSKDEVNTNELYSKLNEIINLNSKSDANFKMRTIKKGFDIDTGIVADP